MNKPSDATEFDYLPGMLPPVEPLEPEWLEPDVGWWLAWNARRADDEKRRKLRRRAVLLTVVPLVLAVACWLVVPRALERLDAWQQQHQGATP